MTKTNIAPLTGGYMMTSIVGIIISLIYVFPRSSQWGFAFTAFFVMMFIASMISMTYGPEEAMLHAGHHRERREKRKAMKKTPIRAKPKTKKKKKKKR